VIVEQRSYVEWRDRWPKVVVEAQTGAAIDALQRYYTRDDSGKPRYTGACLEAMAALNGDADALGPADLVAVSMLSVSVPAEAAIRLLCPDSERITTLLKQIPSDQASMSAVSCLAQTHRQTSCGRC
jgi:hypothetical protein